jgi:hypothetical protein
MASCNDLVVHSRVGAEALDALGMTTTTTSRSNPTRRIADDLRSERARLGITPASLAAAAGCSLSQLANIEAGAVPRQSAVLDRVRAALASVENESSPEAATPGSTKTTDAGGQREGYPAT